MNRLVAAVAVAVLASPATAAAHGLTARADLPLPRWLFGWGAAVVLVISFLALAVLWPRPKLANAGSRPLPGGRLLASRPVAVVCGTIGVGLLALVIAAGLGGSQEPSANIAPALVFVGFWVGLVPVSVVLGDVFAAFNPWRAIGRVAFRTARRPYPDRLGRWPAAAGLLLFTAMELVVRGATVPERIALATIVYTLVTCLAMAVFGVDAWIARGEAFGTYFGLFARMAPFAREGDAIVIRPPLAGLPRVEPLPGTTAFVAVMIGSLTYDGASEGSFYQPLAEALRDLAGSVGADATLRAEFAALAGLAGSILVVLGLYYAGCAGAARIDGARVREVANAFAHSLVPIAFAYVAAHYLTFLLFQGQTLLPLASDPFGRGDDLLGTASRTIDYTIVGAETVWYLQVGLVVVGHALALALAHDHALVRYRSQREAVRSQFWMLGVMVGFTSLALFLLSQANA